MSNNFIIQRERASDCSHICRVNQRAFESSEEAELVKTLRAEGSLRHSLIALCGNNVVGHVAVANASISCNSNIIPVLSVASLSVDPSFQGMGVGARLLNSVINDCMLERETLLFVLGHRDYYPRFGFMPADQFGLRWEHAAPRDTFMVLPLKYGALKNVFGRVRCSESVEVV